MLSTVCMKFVELKLDSFFYHLCRKYPRKNNIYMKKFQICLKRCRKFNNSPFPFMNWWDGNYSVYLVWCTLFLNWNFGVEVGFSCFFCQNPNILLKAWKRSNAKGWQRKVSPLPWASWTINNVQQCRTLLKSITTYIYIAGWFTSYQRT